MIPMKEVELDKSELMILNRNCQLIYIKELL